MAAKKKASIDLKKVPAPLRRRAREGGWGANRVREEVRAAFLDYWMGSVSLTREHMENDGWDNLPLYETMRGWTFQERFKKELLERSEKETASGDLVATRQELQRRWTDIFRDEERETKDRLQASRLLAMSRGDFIDRKEIRHDGFTLAEMLDSLEEEEMSSAEKAARKEQEDGKVAP